MISSRDPNSVASFARKNVAMPRRGSYGIDAPKIFALIAVVIVACAGMNVYVAITTVSVAPLVPVLFILLVAGFVLNTTLRGKFVVWAELLDNFSLKGDERILDMGCGRGAVLLLAAQYLTIGKATGLDLWDSVDQSGNSIDATQRNSVAENVSDKVCLVTGDITAMPLENESFDLVVSSLAIHNIRGDSGRQKAVSEAVRVLRPGGRLMIADLRGTALYSRHLNSIGMKDVSRRRLGWQCWWGGPWAATYLVTATKPDN